MNFIRNIDSLDSQNILKSFSFIRVGAPISNGAYGRFEKENNRDI
jgi:hypothetical protein